jgi:large subunit ribosomal protein L3
MAGHMGDARVTTRNHPLVRIDAASNLLLIKGALPGANGSLLFIRKAKTARIKAVVAQQPAKEEAKKK